MRVLLDGNEISVASPTLAAAIDAGRSKAESGGRAIIEVVLNGEPIVGDALEAPSNDPIDGAEVRLTSADPASLVKTTLLDAAEALEITRPHHTEIAEGLQAGEAGPALEQLSSTLQVWQAAQEVLTRGWMLLGRDSSTLEPPKSSGADSVDQMVERLAGELREIKRALGDQDLAAVADVVGYELEPMTEHWVALLRTTAEQA